MQHYKLQAILKKRFGQQYRAARELGIQESLLSMYLNDRRVIPEKILKKIESILEQSRETFLDTESL